jgi:integrase
MARKTEDVKVRGVWEREPGSGEWWVRYRDKSGKLHREKAGRKSDAIALLNKRRNEIRVGAKLPDNQRSAGVKFSALADAIETFSESHHRDKRSVLTRLRKVRPAFDERVADSIKPEEIDAWLSANTRTPATSNRYRALFSLIFREALRNGKVSSNPARLVRQKKEENGVIRWLTEKEERALRSVILPEHLPELDIALGTGMRLSEQYGLKWANVDLERKEVTLDRTKNYSGRTIPMCASVEAAFLALKERTPKAKPQQRVFDAMPRAWWEDALKASKVTKYRWHDHRHTFCSRLAMKGANLKVIQTLAGHKTIAMTARYAHLDDASLRAAVDMLP